MKQTRNECVKLLKLLVKERKGLMYAMIGGAIATGLSPFYNLYFYSKILEAVITKKMEIVLPYVAALLVGTLVLELIGKSCDYAMDVYYDKCNYDMAKKTAEKAFSMSYEEYERTETMDSLRRVKNGEMSSGGIGAQITSIYQLFQKAVGIFASLVFVGILFSKGWNQGLNFWTGSASTILLVVAAIAILIVSAKVGGISQKYYYDMEKMNEHANAVGTYIANAVMKYENGKDFRVYHMQPLLNAIYNKYVLGVTKEYVNYGKKNGETNAMINVLFHSVVAITYIVVGAKAIYGVIGVGEVLLYAGAVQRLTDNLAGFVSKTSELSYRATYLNEYDVFLSKPDIHYNGTLPVEKREDDEYEITMEHVSFTYPDTKIPVLEDVNLTFSIGETVALVGRNGAGKTTLIKLLCRLYEPTKGRILLNGIDIRYYDYAEYAKIFSVVFQDFKLMAMPIGENIACSHHFNKERVVKSLERVGMKERVEAMEEGIMTRLYNKNGRGIELSGGEAQKIAIARALYKDGPFVILDEPTAALDPIAEAEIYEKFNELIKGKTAIYISHRMSSCKFCDRILVMDHGKIAESGTHEELIKKEGIYAALYDTQANYYREDKAYNPNLMNI